MMQFFRNIYKELTKDKKITSNIFIQGIGQFVSKFLFFIFLMYSARILGTNEFGIFSFSLSFCYLFYTFMSFGFDHLTVKWVAREKFDRFFNIAVARVGITMFGYLLIFACSFFFEKNIFLTINILGIGFCFFSLNNLVFSYFRGIEMMKLESFVLIGQRIFLVVFTIFFLYIHQSATILSLSFSLSLLITFFYILRFIININPGIFKIQGFLFRKEKLVSVIKEAAPIAFTSGLGIIYYRIDSVMIAGYGQMSDVGIYSGAYMMIEGLMLPVRVIMAATFPRLAQYGAKPGFEFYALFKKLLIVLVTLSLIISLIMYFAGRFVFNTCLGNEYMESISVFSILLLSVIALYPGSMVTQSLITLDKQKLYMYIALTCTILNIGLNFFFIPEFGIKGAAWATVITDIILTCSCMFYCFKFLKKKVDLECL